MSENREHLAQAWKAYTEASIKFGVESPEAELLSWAFDKIYDLAFHKPQDALDAILEINKITDEDRVLANLAAGPLETLLVHHGEEVIDRLITLAKSDPKFRDLLPGVWGDSIDEAVWEQIEALYKSNEPNGPSSQ